MKIPVVRKKSLLSWTLHFSGESGRQTKTNKYICQTLVSAKKKFRIREGVMREGMLF